VVLAGDYNVAPTVQISIRRNPWDKDGLIQPKSRAASRRWWTRAERTRSGRCIRRNDVHVLGHKRNRGRATPDCGSIICC